MVNETEILKSLANVKDPETGHDLASSGAVKGIRASGDQVSFSLELGLQAGFERDQVKEEARKAVLSVPGIKNVSITVISKSPAAKRAAAAERTPTEERILKVKNVIPVASGKGGVGKSTVSANLAVTLSKLGFRVGLMDADVYGPSIPTLMGVHEPPKQQGEGKIVPHSRFGVKMISIGFFLPKGEAVIWRGPMLHKTVDQFLGSVDWGELDYLIVDLPPGTGDIQLSLCQKIPLSGAVIVSTPQDLAFEVAEKAISMFQKLNTPILGLIENMSGFVCKKCGSHEEIFGEGGVKRYAETHGIPFLGSIPLATELRIASDQGTPLVDQAPDSLGGKAFFQIAKNLIAELTERSEGKRLDSGPFPKEVSQPEKDIIEIKWVDGHKSTYKAFELRVACPCAMCVDENTGRRLIRQESIRKDVYLLSMDRVGRYGIAFRWSDGHSTGIYTFEYLRSLCGCLECKNVVDAKSEKSYGTAS